MSRGLWCLALLALCLAGPRPVAAGLAGSNHVDELVLRRLDRALHSGEALDCEQLLASLKNVRSPRVRREVEARLRRRNSPCGSASGDSASGDSASGDSASGDSASGDSASGDSASGAETNGAETKRATERARARSLASQEPADVLSMLVVRVVPAGSSGLPGLSESFVAQVGGKVKEFFEENSGGATSFSWQLHSEVASVAAFAMRDGQGSGYVCAGAGFVPDQTAIAAAAREAIGSETYAGYDHVVYALPPCSHLPFAGSGEIPGKQVWMNGMEDDVESFSAVLCHELGHNLGAKHAEHEELEYGNSFSVMGSAHRVPAGHFCASAKAHFGWIDVGSQVVEFESPHAGAERRCAPGRCRGSGAVWVAAHDGGAYAAGTVYALRVHTVDENEFLWVEFRSHYFADSLRPGALLTWVYEEPGSRTFGPTQLVDFESTSPSQDDASVPVGRSYAYDVGRTGVVVSVLQASAARDAILVHVDFAAPDDPAGLAHLAGLASLHCDTAQAVEGDQLLRLHLDHPAELVFEHSCTAADDDAADDDAADDNAAAASGAAAPGAGIYVYPRYPLHLFLPDRYDGSQVAAAPDAAAAKAVRFPGAGASFRTGLDASCDASLCSVRASFEPHFSGEWAPLAGLALNGHPVYSLADAYNLIFVPGQSLPGGGTRNVWVVTSQLAARPTAWFAYVVPSAQDGATELGDVGAAVEAAQYYTADGWTDASAPASFACSAQRAVAHLSDLFTRAQGAVAYHEFTQDNYVLVHGLPSGARLSVTTQCATLHCAAGHYFDAAAGGCAGCPAGTTSAANSQDADACYEACSAIAVSALDASLAYLSPEGVFVQDVMVDGAPSFVSYSGELALYLLNSKWVLGPYAGSPRWYKTLSSHAAGTAPLHPVAAAASFEAIDVECTCAPLPACARCAAGALPDPAAPETCFVPCRSLRVASASRTFLDGTFVFAGLHNGKPRFASASRELWASHYGTWFLGNDHTESLYFLLQHSAAFWPVGMKPDQWRQGTSADVVTITCDDDDEGRLSWQELLPTLATALAEVPTEVPTKMPTLRPTTSRSTKRPTLRPTTSPTTRPTARPTTKPTHRPTHGAQEPAATAGPTSPRATRRPTARPTARPTTSERTATAGPTAEPAAEPTDAGEDRGRGIVDDDERAGGDAATPVGAGSGGDQNGDKDGKSASQDAVVLGVGSCAMVAALTVGAAFASRRARRKAQLRQTNEVRTLAAQAAQHTMQFHANPMHAWAPPPRAP